MGEVSVVGGSKKNRQQSNNFGGGIYYTGTNLYAPELTYGATIPIGEGGNSSYSGTSSSNNSNNNSGGVEMRYYGFQKTITNLWNSNCLRAIIPDALSLNLSTSVTSIVGVSFSCSISFITRGNDASFMPVLTITPGTQIGERIMADASVGFTKTYFLVTDVRQLAPGQAKGSLGGWSVEGVIGAGDGLDGNVKVSIGLDEKGNPTTFNIGASGGVGFGSGWSIGENHTLIIN